MVSAAEYSGRCGKNLYWEIENDILRIYGEGPMYDYPWFSYDHNGQNSPWHGSRYGNVYGEQQLPFSHVVIESGVTSIGNNAFHSNKFSTIVIPDTVERIGTDAFMGTESLQYMIVPDSVKVIEEGALQGPRNVLLPKHLDTLYGRALYSSYYYPKTVYYPGTEAEWNSLNIIGAISTDTTIVFESTVQSMSDMVLFNRYDHFYNYIGDSNIYHADSSSPGKTNYCTLDKVFFLTSTDSTADFTWKSSDESVLQIAATDGLIPQFNGVSSGNVTVTVTNAAGETIRFDVKVLEPVGLEATALYDTQQYYYSGGFYSAVSSLTNSAEVYLEFSNRLNTTYPCKIDASGIGEVNPFIDVTLTATISGNDLSFSKEYYQNTYTAALGDIAYNKTVSDLLSLYPVNPESYRISYGGNPYTVTVTLESESFKEPVVQTYEFSILDAEAQKVKEHTDFALHDTYYKVSKQNIYGKNMVQVKDDPDYRWSKWSTFDFENYHEVVMADILIKMLDVPQADFSIVPKVLKDWYSSYDSLLGDIDDIVTGSCGDKFDVSETKIDKVLKTSKYRSAEGDYVDDDFYLAVVDALADEMNASKIKEAFAKIDETQKVFELVEMVKEPLKEIVAWGNTLSVMNAFDEADQELKDVFRALANEIPSEEAAMKEAVLYYVNYSTDYSGKIREIYDSFYEAAGKVTASSFKNVVGKKLWDCLAIKAVEWIGTITLKDGTKLAATNVYKTLTSASTKAIAGSVLTGVSIGLTLSDLICSSSSKASEMGKLIAMCEYSPYIVNILVKYEAGMVQAQDMKSVLLFENVFKLHQASQSYIMNQTANALKVKADSILQKLLGNEEYYTVVADTLAHKRTVDSMNCCGILSGETVVHTTKIITVRCPVNVEIQAFNGYKYETVASVKNEYVNIYDDDIVVYARDGEKFFAVPANQDYDVRISAYDSGSMDYAVTEYDHMLEVLRTLEKLDIPISNGDSFFSCVHSEADLPFESYALYSAEDGKPYIPVDPTVMKGRIVQHMFRMYDPNSGEHFYTGSTKERDDLVAAGWNYEGVGFSFPSNSGYPVYRLYEPVHGEHLYTMSEEEKDRLIADGWNYEGIAFNSASKYEVTQFRLHNPNALRGAYHFTGSEVERDFLIQAGWEDQGIGWYSAWG